MVDFSFSGLAMLVMTGFLALAAMVQVNDPDPLIWMAAYGLPSALTFWAWLTDTGNWMWRASCVVVLSGLVPFAFSVVSPALRDDIIHNILTSEEGRESAGLVIVIVWLLLLLFQRNYWFDCGLLAFAVLPPSIWIAYKFYVQQTLSLPEHCEGLV